VLPLRLANVDTDQLLPGRFLRKPRSDGYDTYLFHDLRRTPEGGMRQDFPLNQAAYAGAEILVADRNFGGGSSREGAVYALADAGFRCVIAASFGDIFRSNAAKNGVLPVELPIEAIERIWAQVEADPTAPLTVDLAAQTVRLANDPEPIGFAIDPFVKECLLEGKDDIDLTLAHADTLASFEARYTADHPWRRPPSD
jgi:3-isopropylmalate/(R)-2-methylmalate dehydratase small subunit